MHLHTLDAAVLAVRRGVIAVAKEGPRAFLDPAGIAIGVVDDSRATLALGLHVPPRACGTGNDSGGDDHRACALHFQVALLQLTVDQRQQLLIQFGLDQVVAEPTDGAGIGQPACRELEDSEEHEVQLHSQRLLELYIRQGHVTGPAASA